MSKFIKILAVLVLILLVEIIFIYKGYINNKNKVVPSTKEVSPYNYTAIVHSSFLSQRY